MTSQIDNGKDVTGRASRGLREGGAAGAVTSQVHAASACFARWRDRSLTVAARMGVCVVMATMLAAVAVDPAAGGVAEEGLSEDRRLELEHLLENVRDANLDLDRRQRAAEILLRRDWPTATRALVADLGGGAADTQRAIAQAVAVLDRPDALLMEPLEALLESPDAALREDVAAALGRFHDPDLLGRLKQYALEDVAEIDEQGERPEAAVNRKLGAIAALAQHREAEAVELLLDKLEHESAAVREASADALARLSGTHTIGDDVEAWRAWWEQAGQLTPEQWHASLLQNLSNRNEQLAAQLETSVERLVAAHNRLYDETDEEARPQMLAEMLGDPMRELRLLALRLIDRRVLNAQPVGPEVRAAMRERLADSAVEVRRRSALVLETLGDAEGADVATDLLMGERDETVQAAYLTLMARVPGRDVVEPALWLMRQGRAASAAADCLRAASDAGHLSERQVERARATARHHLDEANGGDRSMIRLLAVVGEGEADLERLLARLDHEDSAVRVTAARAFRETQWPLRPLLERLEDAELAPEIVDVAERRGDTLATIEHLLAHEPDVEDDLEEAWDEALRAVAARLDRAAVVRLDEQLAALGRSTLHERLLMAAAAMEAGEEWDAEPRHRRTEAALRLARLHRAAQRFDAAEAIYEHLSGQVASLASEHRQQLTLGRTDVLLATGDVESAVAFNAEALDRADHAPAADDLAEVWVTAAQRDLNGGGDREAISGMLEAAEGLFEARVSGDALARLQQLREQVEDLAAAEA